MKAAEDQTEVVAPAENIAQHALRHVLRAETLLVTAVTAVGYAIGRVGMATFYEEFHVTPSEVGISTPDYFLFAGIFATFVALGAFVGRWFRLPGVPRRVPSKYLLLPAAIAVYVTVFALVEGAVDAVLISLGFTAGALLSVYWALRSPLTVRRTSHLELAEKAVSFAETALRRYEDSSWLLRRIPRRREAVEKYRRASYAVMQVPRDITQEGDALMATELNLLQRCERIRAALSMKDSIDVERTRWNVADVKVRHLSVLAAGSVVAVAAVLVAHTIPKSASNVARYDENVPFLISIVNSPMMVFVDFPSDDKADGCYLKLGVENDSVVLYGPYSDSNGGLLSTLPNNSNLQKNNDGRYVDGDGHEFWGPMATKFVDKSAVSLTTRACPKVPRI